MKGKNEYSYKHFSKQDIVLYKNVLDQMPFEASLQEAFTSFARQYNAQKRSDRRHIANISLDYAAQAGKMMSVEDEALNNLEHESIFKAIDKLTQTQRRRIVAYYFYELSLEQISRFEGVSSVAVWKSIQAALVKLKEILDK